MFTKRTLTVIVKGETFAFGTGAQQHGSHRSSHARTDGGHIRLQILHGIVDAQPGIHLTARAVQVNLDITGGILTPEEVLVMGDDIPDYKMMQLAGMKCCPSDAAEEIKGIADYISPRPGGNGAVRDVIETVLRLHGKWFEEDACIW